MRKAFTLIELLVVIAIIAVLAAGHKRTRLRGLRPTVLRTGGCSSAASAVEWGFTTEDAEDTEGARRIPMGAGCRGPYGLRMTYG